ncbi:MAG TPA: SH3 domain-containing protein [Terriglobales bacterium]|nr:SH3 domain-containing protein [Terriglobales bacterium]
MLSVGGCGGEATKDDAEYGYVTAPSIALRDRVATVYNKVGILNNGDRVLILERSGNKRFARVRSDDKKEGWIPQRYLATQGNFDSFQKLAQQNSGTASQATAVTRRIVNMHDAPGRETPTLFQLKEGERLSLLKRSSAPKVAQKAPAQKPVEPAEVDKEGEKAKEAEDEEDPSNKSVGAPKIKAVKTAVAVPAPVVPMEDWWLVRDSKKRVGWILGRMLDVDVPLEVAQYAEGQRIIASHVLSEVAEKGGQNDRLVPQYLMLLTENKDGLPFDFNQARVFTWNVKRGRYETAFRERLTGELPFQAGRQDFGKEGMLPYFVLRVRDSDGKLVERKYKMNGVMVRRIVEEPEAKSPTKAPVKPGR